MAVFRVEKNSGYTVMSNRHLRNRALSLKAKGLLSPMLSLPEDWDYTLQGLVRINRESIDTSALLATLQTGPSKLGESSGARTKAIRDLIYLIKDIPMGIVRVMHPSLAAHRRNSRVRADSNGW